jgi:hypothetical protein
VVLVLAMIVSAGVAGALFAQIPASDAAPGSGDRSVTETIAPCRVMETRASEGSIGPKTTPLAATETVTLQIAGAAGKGGCTVGTGLTLTGAVLNITAVNATADTFVTVYPCDAPRPTASTLNPFPNRITFNSAVSDLSATGTVCIFNNAGSVDIVVDVTGILYDHNHDDRYYTETEINDAFRSGTLRIAADEFRWADGGAVYDTSANVWIVSGTSDCVEVPVRLPVGATVTRFRAYVNDAVSRGLTFHLARRPLASSVPAPIGTFTISSTPLAADGFQDFTAINGHVVNGDVYTVVGCGHGSGSDWILGIEIAYTGGPGLPVPAS